MKHNARRSIVALLLAVALVASFAFAGAATLTQKTITVKGGVDIYMDGAKVDPQNVNGETVDAFIYEGTTYLPVRAMSEMLGKDVSFDLGTGSVYVTGLAGGVEKSTEYLETMYEVTFNDVVTNGEFNAALATVTGDEAPAMTMELLPATNCQAIESAISYAGMSQLAKTYSEEKAAETIASAGVPFEVPAEDAANYACALDLGLINPNTDPEAELTGTVAAQLAMAVAQMTGHGRNYVGRVSDADIIAKLANQFNQVMRNDVYTDVVLGDVGYQILDKDATTGFGIRCTAYNCNFIPEYTLRYGHSDVQHALQLVTLMNSEGIDAFLQIEPKLSIYQGMAAWVDPEADPTERASAVAEAVFAEYDLMIEFDTVEDKVAFNNVIEKYAKKYAANRNEDGTFSGLIYGAWWQPLYSSNVEMGEEDYTLIYDNVIKNGNYEIHSFSMPENVEKVGEAAKSVSEEVEIANNELWVNNAFYRYLSGTDSE